MFLDSISDGFPVLRSGDVGVNKNITYMILGTQKHSHHMTVFLYHFLVFLNHSILSSSGSIMYFLHTTHKGDAQMCKCQVPVFT